MRKQKVSMREPKAGEQGSKGTTYTYPDGTTKTGATFRYY